MANYDIARVYLEAVVARDYDGVRVLLSDEFRLRDLSLDPPFCAGVASRAGRFRRSSFPATYHAHSLPQLFEFQRPVLEALRQPLEDEVFAIARAGAGALPRALPTLRDHEPVPLRTRRIPGRPTPIGRRRTSRGMTTPIVGLAR